MEALNRTLDAAILKPEFSPDEVRAAIRGLLPYRPKTVCVRPCDIALAKSLCEGTDVGICVVLGFPHGSQLAASKVEEARLYANLGVDEIDMVISIGNVRGHAWTALAGEVSGVVAVTKPIGVTLKVIFETCHLATEEIARMTEICAEAGADFVKTSTGFNGEGASDEAVKTMIEAAAGRIRVKPSGGIRDRARAEYLLSLGATRLGVGYTSVAAILDGPAVSASATAGY